MLVCAYENTLYPKNINIIMVSFVNFCMPSYIDNFVRALYNITWDCKENYA